MSPIVELPEAMRRTRRIAIIGERNLAHRAHAGIEASLELFRRDFDPGLVYDWISTALVTPDSVDEILGKATGVWCAPASPYTSTTGALLAIQYAREHMKAFLGTCGGFQHALMEYAQNVLGRDAMHQEMQPSASQPLIAKLSCSLAGAKAKVIATQGFSEILGFAESTEEFNCNYGLNPDLEVIFKGTDLSFVARDEAGQVRAFRLARHPFFVGTLFQPERRALGEGLHPVVRTFLQSAEPNEKLQ